MTDDGRTDDGDHETDDDDVDDDDADDVGVAGPAMRPNVTTCSRERCARHVNVGTVEFGVVVMASCGGRLMLKCSLLYE